MRKAVASSNSIVRHIGKNQTLRMNLVNTLLIPCCFIRGIMEIVADLEVTIRIFR